MDSQLPTDSMPMAPPMARTNWRAMGRPKLEPRLASSVSSAAEGSRAWDAPLVRVAGVRGRPVTATGVLEADAEGVPGP